MSSTPTRAKRHEVRIVSKRKVPLPPQLKRVNLNAAGIDIGSEEHWVAVPSGRDREGRDVRGFGAFTGDLCALADWLKECDIETVAMESTGVYWIALYELLVERGFEVLLVDTRQAKNVPGRKSDVLDCQWLQELHTYGLLRGAFRPVDQVCILRSYLRQRSMLVAYASHHIQHMQKALEQMNLKLAHVVSDITGLTGMGIIKAILSGERDSIKLAKLRDPRCKSSEATVARALEGHYREEHLFALKQAVELVDFYQQQITTCDRQIEICLQQFEKKSTENPVAARSRKRRRNGITFDARSYLYRMTGVDLTQIDSIEANTALTVIGEIGLDMSRWPTEKHFKRGKRRSWQGSSLGSCIPEFELNRSLRIHSLGSGLGSLVRFNGLHRRSIEMRAGEITGGCLCGDVRFHASGAPRRVTHCHCDMCRRAVGAVVATFATFESSRVEWRGPLSRYDSSDRAWRGFCPRCGSSLCFGYKPRPDRIYVTLGTFDDPNAHPASFHDYLDQKLSWLTIDAHLPTAASAKRSAEKRNPLSR